MHRTLIVILYIFAQSVDAQVRSAPQNTMEDKARIMQHATGPFDVKVAPQKPDSDIAQAANLSRMSLDKQFHGELDAVSKGEMIAGGTEVKGSGAYVAMERVTGTLKGRKGSFLLYHTGIMHRGVPTLSVTVVPDSGTEELKGLAGKMNIIIAPDGKHSYDFEYSLE